MLFQIHRDVEVFPPPATPLFEILDSSSPRLNHYAFSNAPNIIIELLSESTAKVDRGLKKQIYQDTFHTPEYFWFDLDSLEFVGFCLINGTYQPIEPNDQGWM